MKKALFIAVLMIFSCDSALDVEIKNNISTSNFFQSQVDFDLALTGAYDILGNHQDDSGFGTYFRGLLCMGRAGTDEGYIVASFAQYGVELSNYTFTPVSQVPDRVWAFQYKGISRANTVITRLERAGDIDMPQAERNRIEGEARFLRAFYYFQLVRYYGGVPLVTEEVTDISQVNFERASIADVYAQIIEDLQAAEQLLPISNENGRAERYAATAFLAKAYLQMSGFPLQDDTAAALAAQKAKEVMDSGLYALLPNYEDVFKLENEYTSEYIFSVQFAFCGNCEGGQVGTWDGIPGNWAFARTYNIFRTFNEHYDAYDPNDLRRDYNIVDYRIIDADGNTTPTNDGNKYAFKWRHAPNPEDRPGGTGWFEWQSSFDFPLTRYADILLTYAEAINRSNGAPNAEAYEAINRLRRRGFGVDMTMPSAVADLPTGLSFNEFQDAVLDERKFELCYEGHRWHDLVRFGKLIDAVKSINSPESLERSPAANNIQPHHVFFPIPQSQIQISDGVLIQNEGY
ncbi:RagB/SusD family nutrient uptake outer membrane protein [Aestuariivivens sediminicola]|uniref:RagB/SusD family nutrient uptake outer membrane protein n=1 Tax=Aestuariivivens sediminicola TaxID=2913560 RepID=UPI001F570DCB|nr:RagB/SusD family nutrient uptake outer membrane protein [Aestuariivivens sediminicola]